MDVTETFCVEKLGNVFLGFFANHHLRTTIELSCSCGLFSTLTVVRYRVIDIRRILLTVVVYSLWLFISETQIPRHLAWDFALISDIVVR